MSPPPPSRAFELTCRVWEGGRGRGGASLHISVVSLPQSQTGSVFKVKAMMERRQGLLGTWTENNPQGPWESLPVMRNEGITLVCGFLHTFPSSGRTMGSGVSLANFTCPSGPTSSEGQGCCTLGSVGFLLRSNQCDCMRIWKSSTLEKLLP